MNVKDLISRDVVIIDETASTDRDLRHHAATGHFTRWLGGRLPRVVGRRQCWQRHGGAIPICP